MEPKDEIKQKLDIIEVVSEYLVLNPAGTHNKKARCPFHEEKTASFCEAVLSKGLLSIALGYPRWVPSACCIWKTYFRKNKRISSKISPPFAKAI